MIDKISIITWLWSGNREYLPEHVKILGNSLRKHMSFPYRFIVIADDTVGDFGDAEVIKTPENALRLSNIGSPECRGKITKGIFPSCYRRLWLFSEEAKTLGNRIINTDVDCVVTDDWLPLIQHDHSFVGWQPEQRWGTEKRVAGGMWMLNTGSYCEVYEDFIKDPILAIKLAREAGYRGSDQAWLSYKLASKVSVWPPDAGIISIRDLKNKCSIPASTRVVHFNGSHKPWDKISISQHSWLTNYIDAGK